MKPFNGTFGKLAKALPKGTSTIINGTPGRSVTCLNHFNKFGFVFSLRVDKATMTAVVDKLLTPANVVWC